MLRRILPSSILVGIVLIYFCHVRLRPGDLPFYRKLVQESVDLRGSSALEKSPIRQIRQRVRKDFWTIKEGARVHGSIVSAESDLILSQKKEKMEGVESSREIEAWIDVGDGMRRLTAESGTCRFPSCDIDAEHLSFQFGPTKCVALRCHFAKDVNTIQLLGSFQIEHPKGRIFGEKGTCISEGGCNYLQFEDGVLFEGTQAPFSIASLSADAVIPHQATLPEEIRFSDSVQIQSVHGLRGKGDFAIYHQNFLRLFPEPGSTCSIFHGEDRVDAREIQFDKAANELLCLSPHGRLEESQTLFDADTGRAQFLYRAQEGFVNVGSASQRKIDPNEAAETREGPADLRSEEQVSAGEPARRDHSRIGKADEEGRFCKGAASQNSHNLTERGMKGFQLQTLLLEGNVRIASLQQRKESFAMADSAAVHLNQKRIILESVPSSRVLFRQEGLEISAPTVHIQESAIQGFGDVRFYFSPEEKTALEPIFLKFL